MRAELQQLFGKAARARMMRRLLIGAVKGYRLLLTPWLGASCRFEPTCSVYAIEALKKHGAAAGSYLTLRAWRAATLVRGGHDPVPPAARSCFTSLSPLTPRQEVFFMNDIRRTILWVIFGFSLVMLWDQWQVHNGASRCSCRRQGQRSGRPRRRHPRRQPGRPPTAADRQPTAAPSAPPAQTTAAPLARR